MHRSGTSASTGALQCVGVQLGEKLYAGHSDVNAKGYFEHSDIADTNEEVLLRLGSAWDDVLIKPDGWWKRAELRPFADKMRGYIRRDFSNSQLWAVKDPRVCRLLPWWLEIFKAEGISPHFLFVVRSPQDVYGSLQRRDGFSREKSYMLWLLHYLEAEAGSRGYPRTFSSFDHFLEDPQGELRRIERQLGLRFPISVESAGACLGQFLSKDLRHHQAGEVGEMPESVLVGLAHQLDARLRSATQAAEATLDTTDLYQQVQTLQSGLDALLVEQLRSVGVRRGEVELTVHRLMRSWSWFTGKPVRVVERLFGRDV
ncbi:MAG: hypothetical protein PHF75_00915 [Gallionella sp.]|nr:hypothetical protein [Gallionella sp.]